MSPDCRDGSPGADKSPSITAVPQKEKDTGGLLLSDRDHGSFFSLSLVSFTESVSFFAFFLLFAFPEMTFLDPERFKPSQRFMHVAVVAAAPVPPSALERL